MTLAGKTFRYGLGPAGTYLVVHGEEAPAPDEWAAYVADMEKHARAGALHRVFVCGTRESRGPNATQRKLVADMWKRVGASPPIVVVFSSQVVRGIVTAMNWLLAQPIKAFGPDQFDEALSSLGLGPAERAQVQGAVRDTLKDLEAFAHAG